MNPSQRLDTQELCPDCGGQRLHDLGPLPGNAWFAGVHHATPQPPGRLLACAGCGLRFRWPRADGSVYLSLYTEVAVSTWADEVRPDFELVVEQVRRRVPAGARLLDLGCHTGALLSLLQQDYACFGVEPNPSARAIALTRGVRQAWEVLDAVPAGERFDAILCCDVIEHVPSPARLLAQLMDRLTPGGLLIFSTGDADSWLARLCGPRWWYCFYSEHISFVSSRWLQAIVARQGLALLDLQRFCHAPVGAGLRMKRGVMALGYAVAPGLVGGALAAVGSRAFVEWPVGDGVAKDHLCAVLTHAQSEVRNQD